MQPKITVIGSINMDLVTEANRRPEAGETVLGKQFSTIPGGKGANQAVAAARIGGKVTMIGCVGEDPFGKELLDHLEAEGIIIDNMESVPGVKTGIAAITLAEEDNSIVVVPGANNLVTERMILQNEEVIANSDAVLLQLEIPLSTVVNAAAIAYQHGVRVILNPAPFQKLPDKLIDFADVITPNEHEYEELIKDYSGDLNKLKEKLVITKGGEGIVYYEKGTEIHVPGHQVEVVDTTGAGDSFNGGLAVQLAKGASFEDSCHYACAVGALSVTKFGAQSGMPTDKEVNGLLKNGNKERI
ncbi:ribokinase [Virgibacillus dakarensis]|uniref:ribokinase n=1 Tax=Virgibacillus dakarensis TaxID=1917889 RepID=UPI000B434188|nr:ribokinase [Virgibacillus dakarensis]MBT2216992.1 ribokinase [Virgibacillus dakarensis]MTW87866.1 ribokinase [Virgibacillus dakarensis]